jgi:hypothetical protein
MRPLFGRIKRFAKSGAYLYLPAKLVEDTELFPFKEDDIVKLEVDKKHQTMIVSIPQWWELLDWSKMPDAFEKLPPDVKDQIKQSGIMPDKS